MRPSGSARYRRRVDADAEQRHACQTAGRDALAGMDRGRRDAGQQDAGKAPAAAAPAGSRGQRHSRSRSMPGEEPECREEQAGMRTGIADGDRAAAAAAARLARKSATQRPGAASVHQSGGARSGGRGEQRLRGQAGASAMAAAHSREAMPEGRPATGRRSRGRARGSTAYARRAGSFLQREIEDRQHEAGEQRAPPRSAAGSAKKAAAERSRDR